MTSPLGEHNLGTHYLLTGYRPTPVLEYPSFQTVANFRTGRGRSALPGNIAIPNFTVCGAKFSGAYFLQGEYGPFALNADPAQQNFRVRDLSLTDGLTLDRMQRRQAFANKLAEWNAQGLAGGESSDHKAVAAQQPEPAAQSVVPRPDRAGWHPTFAVPGATPQC